MDKLKFDGDVVDVVGAAITLAINQEPWASRIRCSLLDFCEAGLDRYGYEGYRCVLKKPGADMSWLAVAEDINPEESFFHKMMIYPDSDVDAGEVRL